MKKRINILASQFHVIFFLILVFGNFGWAQTTLISDLVDPAQQNNSLLYENSAKFLGTRFLIDDFNIGTVLLKSGKEYKNILLRYNAFDDFVHAKDIDSGKESILLKPSIGGFKFYVPNEQKYYVFTNVEGQFYEEIVKTEEFSILKKHSKTLVKGAAPNGYNSIGNETLDRLINTSSYYVYDHKSKGLSEFSVNKKLVYKFLIEKKIYKDTKEIKSYVSKNNINLKTDAGINQAVLKE